MHHNKRYKKAKKITIIGAAINLLLGFIKVIGGVFFNSHALIADGVHSFSDLLTDGMVIIASKYGSQAADDKHPYGHQKIETAATLLLAMLLILAGFGIAWDSLSIILRHEEHRPAILATTIAILSIVANELLFQSTYKIGKEINSSLVIANAWHHRSDAAAPGVVLIGLIGSSLGFTLLDPIAAVVIGGMIIKMGISYGWNSVQELIDAGINKQESLNIEKIINNVDGVMFIHQLRSRMMGKDIFVGAHIQVSPLISVSEGHHIAQTVHKKLLDKVSQIKDVTIHVDPENDEIASPSLLLPSRKLLEKRLIANWQKDFPEILSWTIHYLDGKVSIDIWLAKNFNQWKELKQRLKNDMLKESNISIIQLLSLQDKITSDFVHNM